MSQEDRWVQVITRSGTSLEKSAIVASEMRALILRQLADKTLAVVRTVQGAADTSIEQEGDQPGLRISVDRSRTARYGLNVNDLTRVIESALGGAAIGSVFEQDRRFDIAVRYAPEWRSDIGRLRDILVRTPDGAQVPLSQLADVRVVTGASIIGRWDNQRAIAISQTARHARAADLRSQTTCVASDIES